MERFIRIVLAVLVSAVCLCSCGRDGKVIPRSKLSRIYAEMFLADAWLNTAPMDALVNIFYTQCLTTLISEADKNPDGRLRVPTRIMMDDFASSALIADFDRIISVVRSRDIWITILCQSISQLQSLYTSEQATTILNCCDHLIFTGCNDLKSAEYIGTWACKTEDVILTMGRANGQPHRKSV